MSLSSCLGKLFSEAPRQGSPNKRQYPETLGFVNLIFSNPSVSTISCVGLPVSRDNLENKFLFYFPIDTERLSLSQEFEFRNDL